MLPMHEMQQKYEIFFCKAGQATVNLLNGERIIIERHHILLLAGTENLRSVTLSGNLQGILVSIDCPPAQEKEGILSTCTALGLDIDLCRLKLQLDAMHDCTALRHSCWTNAVFHCLSGLSEDAAGRYCFLKALELLYLLSKRNSDMEARMEHQDHPQAVQSVLDARTYLENHMSEKITIDELCRKFMVSPTYLKAEFRRMYGTSIHRWLIDLRMRQAGEWICCTDRPIYQIARDVGYEGMSQFSAAFKKYYGTTPSEFKKMSKTAMPRLF